MTVLLVGCGRMGGAMVRGWRGRERVLVYDPMAALPEGAERVERLEDVPCTDDLIVVLAVKPQAFPDIAPLLAPLAECAPLIVSIMAGIPLAKLWDPFGSSFRVVRAMPNTPAAIGKGITGAVAARGVSEADQCRIDTLLAPLGDLIWFRQESDLDIVTAVSGSGPAYFFRMTEALGQAGTKLGLPEDLAMRLARATLIGAAALAEVDERSLAELRLQVTSPGGTTAAGLEQMNHAPGIDVLLADVVSAATRRSAELAD